LATADHVESLPPLDQEELPPLDQRIPPEDPGVVYATRGAPVTLSAVGLEAGATYQWEKSEFLLPWESLPDTNAPTLDIRMSEPLQFCTRYRVRIAHSDGRIEYQERKLVPLLNAPSFVTDLPDIIVAKEGRSLTLHVDARPTYKYDWYRDGKSITTVYGDNGGIYVTPPLTSADDGARFYAEVEDFAGNQECYHPTRVRSRVLTVRVEGR
jgi:hypothetical protein